MADQRLPRITIIGTGLIGASLGMRLRAAKDRKFEVVGLDADGSASRQAKQAGAVDKTAKSLEEALQGAGLVVLATPIRANYRLLKDMGEYIADNAVITDTASTKTSVVKWADELLPRTVSFVGGHPMTGSEQSGPSAARADLFEGATWAVTPSRYASEGAIRVVLNLIEQAGALPVHIDPEEHDQYVAAVSHVPLLLSVALFRMAKDSHGWEDMSLLSGPAFRDLTRLASGHPRMSTDIMATNHEAILHWVQRFQDELAAVKAAIEVGEEAASDLFTRTFADREVFLDKPRQREMPRGEESPSAADSMGQLLFGGAMYQRLKEITTREPSTGDPKELRRKLGIDDEVER